MERRSDMERRSKPMIRGVSSVTLDFKSGHCHFKTGRWSEKYDNVGTRQIKEAAK
jgi:hypothetical protein